MRGYAAPEINYDKFVSKATMFDAAVSTIPRVGAVTKLTFLFTLPWYEGGAE